MNAAAIFSFPEAYADPETWHAEVSEIERQPAATFVGAPKRIPIRYRVRAA